MIEGHPLMVPLENWVLDEALDLHERWLAAGQDTAVSVNMSGSQLHQRDFVQRLRATVAARPRVVSFSLDDFGTGNPCSAI